MAVHGKGAGVWLAQFDLSGDFTGYNFGKSNQNVDITTMGLDDRVFLAGTRGGNISVQGIFDSAVDKSDEEIQNTDGTTTVITASPTAAAAIGDRAHMVFGIIEDYQPRSSITDAVRFSAGFQSNAGAFTGIILHHNNQESSTGNHTGVSSLAAAASANGAVAFLHVTEFNGTDATITIEDAATEPTYGSLVAFTQVTGLTSERVTVAGEVLRFARVALSGTFTTITFVVSFSRTLP